VVDVGLEEGNDLWTEKVVRERESRISSESYRGLGRNREGGKGTAWETEVKTQGTRREGKGREGKGREGRKAHLSSSSPP